MTLASPSCPVGLTFPKLASSLNQLQHQLLSLGTVDAFTLISPIFSLAHMHHQHHPPPPSGTVAGLFSTHPLLAQLPGSAHECVPGLHFITI